MTAAADLPPWMIPLSETARKAVRRNVAEAPPLTDAQRETLRRLFNGNGGAG